MEWQMPNSTMWNLWNQAVFIEVETKQQCKNLPKTTKLLGYLPVKVSPHRTLKSSKFIIKCEELDKMDEEEIIKRTSATKNHCCQENLHTIQSVRFNVLCWMWWRRTQFRWLPKRTKMCVLSRWPCCYIKRLSKMENWERHCDPQIYRKDFIRRCSQTFTTLFRPIKGFICNCNTDPSSIFKTSSTMGQKNPTSNWLYDRDWIFEIYFKLLPDTIGYIRWNHSRKSISSSCTSSTTNYSRTKKMKPKSRMMWYSWAWWCLHSC